MPPKKPLSRLHARWRPTRQAAPSSGIGKGRVDHDLGGRGARHAKASAAHGIIPGQSIKCDAPGAEMARAASESTGATDS
jgi:hypothetical protein